MIKFIVKPNWSVPEIIQINDIQKIQGKVDENSFKCPKVDGLQSPDAPGVRRIDDPRTFPFTRENGVMYGD